VADVAAVQAVWPIPLGDATRYHPGWLWNETWESRDGRLGTIRVSGMTEGSLSARNGK